MSCVCEQGCPALIQTRNITVATRPLGSRRTRAQRHVSLNTVALRVQRGLCAHWPVGKRAGGTTWQLSQSVHQRRSEAASTTPRSPESAKPPRNVLFCTVLYWRQSRNSLLSNCTSHKFYWPTWGWRGHFNMYVTCESFMQVETSSGPLIRMPFAT